MSTRGKIELEVFAGRPNPTWTLTEEQTLKFLDAFEELEKISKASLHSELGYRGLKLSIDTKSYKIFEGLISSASEKRRDQNRIIERWLLSTGLNAVDESIVRYALEQIK
jgi:hypothetical protein